MDQISRAGVHGWAMGLPWRRQVKVKLLIDGEIADAVVASRFRHDIVRLYGGSGRHGFHIPIPSGWSDGLDHDLAVIAGEPGTHLPVEPGVQTRIPLKATKARPQESSARARALLASAIRARGTGHDGPGPVALFACHSATGKATISQINLLKALAKQGCRTIVCQSSLENYKGFVDEVSAYCSDIVIRHDEGRDFASWCLLFDLFETSIRSADYLVLLNDSFFCVHPDLKVVFDCYDKSSSDFFGITDSYQQKYHLQSSFLILSPRAANSSHFRDFISCYPFPNDRNDVVFCGEIQLSQDMMRGDLIVKSMLDVESTSASWLAQVMAKKDAVHERLRHCTIAIEDNYNINPQHLFWRQILDDSSIPLIKRELLALNPAEVSDISDVVPLVSARYGPGAAQALHEELAMLPSCPLPNTTSRGKAK